MTNVKELSTKTNIEYDDNLMNIRLRQLRAFLAVVDTGSVSQAAVMIALTQSSVSKLISGLEDEIGFMLFDRLGRRFRLTEQGRMFLVQARDAIESFNDIRRHAMDIRDNQGKRLRVCAIGPLSFGQLMPRGLADFARSQPNFSISFETMFRIEIEDWVAQFHYEQGQDGGGALVFTFSAGAGLRLIIDDLMMSAGDIAPPRPAIAQPSHDGA